MIDHGEIEHKAHEFEINTSDVQRDSVLGWILNGIYAVSDLKRILVLKGGCQKAERQLSCCPQRWMGNG